MNLFGGNFSYNTYSYTQNMTAAACLRHLSALGAKSIELMAFPGHLWIDADRATLLDIRTILQMEGMRLSSLNTTNIDLNITGAAPEMRAYSLDMVEAYLRLAGELGAPGFILGPGKANPLHPLPEARLRGYFFEALDRLVPIARETGVELWAENMPFAFLPDIDGLLATLDSYGEAEIGICYDVANAHFIGEDPAAGIARIGSRLKLLHISDTGRSHYRHDPIGMGDVDFASSGRALGNSGLTAPPVLEIISPQPDRYLAEAEEALRRRGFYG